MWLSHLNPNVLICNRFASDGTIKWGIRREPNWPCGCKFTYFEGTDGGGVCTICWTGTVFTSGIRYVLKFEAVSRDSWDECDSKFGVLKS